MSAKLFELKAEARRLHREGDYARALRAYERILAAVPHDYDSRFRIADLLARVGLDDDAAEVYRTVALHDTRTGHPLPAIVAAHLLGAMGRPADDIFTLLAQTYASGSPQLARFAVRQSPVDPDTAVELPRTTEQGDPFDKAAARAVTRALDLSGLTDYPQQYYPLPFFSDLGPDAFIAVVRSLTVRRLTDGEVVLRQGDRGDALYLIATGEVRVYATDPGGIEREVARLFENTLFGEMALLTNLPRAASVAVVGEADVIEVSRAALERVIAVIPAVRDALDRFARERLIKNLLASSPLFAPFSKPQQAELLKRFEGVDVDAGTEIIKQGEPGAGLFLMLAGEVEVIARNADGDSVNLARLGTGDLFGEMSLITNQPTSATVRAVTRASLLYLSRMYVERLAGAIPEVSAYFAHVAAHRARDNSLRLGARAVPEHAVELDDSDVILI